MITKNIYYIWFTFQETWRLEIHETAHSYCRSNAYHTFCSYSQQYCMKPLFKAKQFAMKQKCENSNTFVNELSWVFLWIFYSPKQTLFKLLYKLNNYTKKIHTHKSYIKKNQYYDGAILTRRIIDLSPTLRRNCI